MLWPSRDERIARTADKWAARSERTLSDIEVAERDAWRAADPRHEQAWRRASALMSATGGMRRSAPVPPRPVAAPRFRPAYAFAGVVAAIAAAGGAIVFERELHPIGPAAPAEYAASQGPRQLVLADGTTVTLEPASAIRTDFSGPIRSVLLTRGSARFDVAHDPAHPFVVSAADRKVTAIGTRFVVALQPRGVVVTLLQGAIEVAATTSKGSAKPVRMTRGQRLTVEDGRETLDIAPPSDQTSALGAHEVAPTPVGSIVAQANRSAATPIRFADPSLGDQRIQGRFDTRDSAALAQQLGAALDLVVTRHDGAWLLSKP